MHWGRHLSIRFRLSLSLGLLAMALLALGISGFMALEATTAKTRTIVEDGVDGLGDLTRINDMYSNIVRDTQGVVLGELSFEEGLTTLTESLAQIDKDWADYLASGIGADASKIVAVAKQRMVEAAPNIAQLTQLMSNRDLPGLTEFTKTTLGDTMESVASQFDQLAELQIGVAAADYASAKALSSFAGLVMAIIAGLSACILGYALFVVLRGVMRPLDRMESTMRLLAAGDASVTVPYVGRRDEIGRMADAVEIFRQNADKVRAMTAAESAGNARVIAERAAMMQTLQQEFGQVVDAAIAGDFSKRVAATFADGELKALAGSVNSLVDTVDRGMGEAGGVLTALARMDLSKRVEGQFSGAFEQLKTDTNAVAMTLSEIVGQLKATSGSLRTATGEILSGANDLSDRTTKQAATIEETFAAVEQLTETVSSNASKAEAASAKAAATTQTAEQSGAVMADTTRAMEQITASSAKISNIIGVIDDIAFQTNLLALNASVEAARAGDAGKGFAVVAVEVRRLAQSAAQASGEVKALIDQSAKEVQAGSRLVSDAAGKLEAVVASIRSNNEALGEIARASRAQASSLEEVRTAVRTMDEMTQHNAALVEETNAAIEQTEAQARELDKVVDLFTLKPGASHAPAARVRPAAAPAGRLKPAAPARRPLPVAGNTAIDPDWSAF